MDHQFLGWWQFEGAALENIDPALHEPHGDQQFNYDADVAMDTTPGEPVQDFHSDERESSLPDSPMFPMRDPHAGTFGIPPPTQMGPAPPLNGGFQVVQRKKKNRRVPVARTFAPHSFDPPPTTSAAAPTWQTNNPYAPLSRDYRPSPISTRHWQNHAPTGAGQFHGSRPNGACYPGPSVEPLHRRANGGGAGYSAYLSVDYQFGNPARRTDAANTHPNAAAAGLSPHNWNLDVYNTGDRMQIDPLVPPTPAASSQYQSGSLYTPSISVNGLTWYTCDTCGKGFDKKYKLDHHRRNHKEPTHTCAVCGRKFIFEKDLRRHVATHNKSERLFFCSVNGCKYHREPFGRKDNLKRHMRKMHAEGLLSPPATNFSRSEAG